MKRAIIELKLTGECPIDIDKAVKHWSLLCRIYKYKDSYTLVQLTPKGKNKLKVSISKEQAEELIKRLELKEVDSIFLNNSKTYLNC
jgi:hypothetical protein